MTKNKIKKVLSKRLAYPDITTYYRQKLFSKIVLYIHTTKILLK
jgi:hypothetical protein